MPSWNCLCQQQEALHMLAAGSACSCSLRHIANAIADGSVRMTLLIANIAHSILVRLVIVSDLHSCVLTLWSFALISLSSFQAM